MKKLLAVSLVALFSFSAAQAQNDDKMIFNHLSVGITTGTPGLIGVDFATTCTPYLQIRAGISIMPNIKYSTNIKVNASDYNNQITNMYNTLRTNAPGKEKMMEDENGQPWRVADEYAIQGKLGWTNGKILFDFFPFTSKGFPLFITVGAYFGGSEIISVYNKDDGALQIVNKANEVIDEYNSLVPASSQYNHIAAKVGTYDNLGPDAQGNVKFDVKVNGFKPYLGIGFGRPVPMTKRIGFQVELGMLLWKTPTVTFKGNSEFDIEKDRVKDDKDVGKAFDVISKFSVWPCLTFRLCGKIL